MPGRQAHGRSLLSGPKKAKAKPAGKASKNRSQKNALNAFGIAQDNFAPRDKKTPRARQLDAELSDGPGGGAADGDEEDEDEDMDGEEEGPQRKKHKGPARRADVEYASDSDGNDFIVGGMAEDDDDSEIESDDAFGDGDDDKFQGYSFKGSKAPQRGEDETDDDSQDDEGETLGADAIDLATALDQYESDSDDAGPAPSGSESGSEDDDDDDDADSEEDHADDDDSATSDDDEDPDKMAALQGMVSGFGTADDDADAHAAPKKQKLELSDLGLTGIEDPSMRNALKLMKKEESAKGATRKLNIPLTRREQGRNERAAAYAQTNKEASKWADTIQHNREAEHLVFPLPQNADMFGVDTTEIKPLTAHNAAHSELGTAVLGIMAESGLSTRRESAKPRVQEYDEDGNLLTRKQIQNRKRKEREENAREAKRQRRIKKIKSKAYRRVHKKDKEGVAGSDEEHLNSDEEREAADRRRALERVGARHKESKWAKLGNKAKRAVWDDDFRAGLSEMARRDEELRRRKSGKAGEEGDSDDTSSEGSDSGDDEDEDQRLLREIARLEEDDGADGGPRKGLEGLKFMRDADARKKQEEQRLLDDIKRTITGDEDGDGDEQAEVGRRVYGKPGQQAFKPAIDTSNRPVDDVEEFDDADDNDDVEIKTTSGKTGWTAGPSSRPAAEVDSGRDAGGWAVGNTRKRKLGADSKTAELDTTALSAAPAPKPKSSNKSRSKPAPATHETPIDDADSSASDSDSDAPAARRSSSSSKRAKPDKAALLSRAFAADDSIATAFEAEKSALAEDEDDKVVDNTLPGWGSWVGDGVSKREQAKHKGRFVKKVEGVKKADRKDAALDRVIMHEKPVKSADQKQTHKYLATQLPQGYETRTQYERALRMPVGQEWQTRETFKKGIQPRVQVKQGVITPMSKPLL